MISGLVHPTECSHASRKIIRSNKDSEAVAGNGDQDRAGLLFCSLQRSHAFGVPEKKIVQKLVTRRPTDRTISSSKSRSHRPPPLPSLRRCPEQTRKRDTQLYSPHFPPRGGTPLGGRGGTQSERGKVCCTAEWVPPPSPPLPDFRLY